MVVVLGVVTYADATSFSLCAGIFLDILIYLWEQSFGLRSSITYGTDIIFPIVLI